MLTPFLPMAEATRIELATSGVTGRRSNQLNRGRDVRCQTPPAQIRTRSITSYGSYLG